MDTHEILIFFLFVFTSVLAYMYVIMCNSNKILFQNLYFILLAMSKFNIQGDEHACWFNIPRDGNTL